MTTEPGPTISELSVNGEQALWRAVITQALMDASSQSKKMEQKYEKSQAPCWILTNSRDFCTVCEYAGFDPRYIREQAIKALERNCQWRTPTTPQKKDISKYPHSSHLKEDTPCH